MPTRKPPLHFHATKHVQAPISTQHVWQMPELKKSKISCISETQVRKVLINYIPDSDAGISVSVFAPSIKPAFTLSWARRRRAAARGNVFGNRASKPAAIAKNVPSISQPIIQA